MELNQTAEDKKQAIVDCIDLSYQEATKMATSGKEPAEIQATARSFARAVLNGTKLFTAAEINLIVDSIKVVAAPLEV